MSKLSDIQTILGVEADGKWGPKSQAALDAEIHPTNSVLHIGKASSFADLRDVEAFRRCKETGKSDKECFRVGDNGVGCFGDDVTRIDIPYVAVPPEDMEARWGSVSAAKGRHINLTIGDNTRLVFVGDRMPAKRFITNGAVIDLAPGAQVIFNLKAPFMVPCKWQWA
jgi:hypothetical protein